MIVRETEVELPREPLLALVVQPHFQTSYDPGFANFDPHTFLVSAFPPRAPRDRQGRIELFEFLAYLETRLQGLLDQQRLPFLLQETAWSHEIEHFHDCLCTTAGFTAFLREWLLLFGASSQLRSLAATGWVARNRIAEPAASDPASSDVLNSYVNLVLYRLLFNGDVAAVQLPPSALEYDIVWGRYELGPALSFRIPFFPSDSAVAGIRQCVGLPLGFRAMTEFRALLYQSHIIRSLGQEYVDQLFSLVRKRFEYGSVNAMMTRVAKRNGVDFRQPWFGDAMFSLVGAALARDAGKGAGANPAASLIALLKEVDPPELPTFTRHQQNLQHMRDVIEGGFLDQLPTGDWYGFHLRDFGIRCFREALQGLAESSDPDPDPFPRDSLSWYSTHLERLPRPPLSFQNGQLGRDLLMTDEAISQALTVTSRWIVYRTVLEQSIIAQDLRCAVLEGPYSAFLQQDTPHEYCVTGISQGGCGTCRYGDSLTSHPNCVWKTTLTDLGLATR